MWLALTPLTRRLNGEPGSQLRTRPLPLAPSALSGASPS